MKEKLLQEIMTDLYERYGKSEDPFHLALENRLKEALEILVIEIDSPKRLDSFISFVDAVYKESIEATKSRANMINREKEVDGPHVLISSLKLLQYSLEALQKKLIENAENFEHEREMEHHYLQLLKDFDVNGKLPS